MATMVGTQMNIFGIFVGFLIPSLFVDDYNGTQDLTDEAVRSKYETQLFHMNCFASVIATVIAVLVIISFREMPGKPLFGSQHQQQQQSQGEYVVSPNNINNAPTENSDDGQTTIDAPESKLSMMQQMKMCLGCNEYTFTSLGTCGIIMHMYIFTTFIGQLVAPYGVTESDFVSKMGLYLYGFGIFGGILFSIVLTYFPRKMMSAAYILSVGSLICLSYFLFQDINANKPQLIAASTVLGFFLVPILLVAYELAVEQTAHQGVSENMSCGLINIYANFVGFLIAIALTPALGEESQKGANWTFGVLFINLLSALGFLLAGSMLQNRPNNKNDDIE